MTLIQAVKQKNISEIRRFVAKTPVSEIANLINDFPDKERILFFTLLKSKQQSKIFYSLDSTSQEKIVKAFNNNQIKEIVEDIFTDDIVDIISDVPEDIAQKILKATTPQKRKAVNKILKYNDDQIGFFMTLDIATIRQSMTVQEASKHIRKQKDKIRMSHYFFVVNARNKLLGYVALEDLFFEKSYKKVRDITKPVVFVKTTTHKEEASLIFANNDMSVLPVVNSKNEVLGMITADDVIDVVQESATEDIQKMAGISGPKFVDNDYSKMNTFQIFRSRIFWLILLMLSSTLSQYVLDVFQGVLVSDENAIILEAGISSAIIAIVPVISGAAGNAGSQSSTTITRALSVGNIKSSDYLKVFWKELKIALITGLVLGVANFLRLVLYYYFTIGLDLNTLYVSLAASLSLFVVINLAKIVGGTLPLVAKKLKLDPAVMAAPILTTLLDALSITIFFSISIGIMFVVIQF